MRVAKGVGRLAAWVALSWFSLAAPLMAQLNLPGLGEDPLGGDQGPPKVEVAAVFTAPTAEQPARLFITAQIAPGFHIYALTQKPGGPVASKIELDSSPSYQLAGAFAANKAPKVHYERSIWPDLALEEYEGKVTWSAPIQLAAGVDPAKLKISGKLDTQACDPNVCIPLTVAFTAALVAKPPIEVTQAAPVNPPAANGGSSAPAGPYHVEGSSVVIDGYLDHQVATPGSTVQLVLSAVPEATWHVYAAADHDPDVIGKGKPTLIVVESGGTLGVGAPRTTARAIEKDSLIPGAGKEKYHEGPVTWTVDLKIPADAAPGPLPVFGLLGYQVCFDKGCKAPMGVQFTGTLEIGDRAVAGQTPLGFEKSSYTLVAAAAKQTLAQQAAAPGDTAGDTQQSLAWMLLLAFAGGVILNLMPCVLPVIGLKIMSFVEQAGHSRREALALNIWYSLGLMSVFLALATMAVVFRFTWGQHFGSNTFSIILASLVFAMALSLLGVWEIPIPGFVGGSKAYDLTAKEGPLGAFLKGVLTTVLATPCTGPLMGTALGWAVEQPPATTYSIFASLGFGMASPYLLIGAFPALMRFLPKPGMWMVTFKQIMGFILLGTVIWMLTFVDLTLVVPTAALLTGIGLACWWISRTPLTEELSKQLKAWAIGGVITALVAYLAFADSIVGYVPGKGLVSVPGLRPIMEYRLAKHVASVGATDLPQHEGELPWKIFTPEKLAELKQRRKTVLVDFTADWCATCKVLEQTVLNTDPVIELVNQNAVQTLVADYTRYPPAIEEVLKQLKSNGVPVIAIYPAGDPENPIVFRGAYTQSALLEALRRAGPSQDAALVETAMAQP